MKTERKIDPLAFEILDVAVEEGWLSKHARQRFIEMYGAILSPDFVRVALKNMRKESLLRPGADSEELLFGNVERLHTTPPRRRPAQHRRRPRQVDRRAQEKLRRMRLAQPSPDLKVFRGKSTRSPKGCSDVPSEPVNHDLTVSPDSSTSQVTIDRNAKKVRAVRGQLVEFAGLEAPVAVLLLGQAADQIAKMELSNLADGIVLSLRRPTL